MIMNFFVDQAFGSVEISKTSCPVFFFAIVMRMFCVSAIKHETTRKMKHTVLSPDMRYDMGYDVRYDIKHTI